MKYVLLLLCCWNALLIHGATIINILDDVLDAEPVNNNPLIGVLSQEISFTYLEKKYPGMYKSYIAASYVKFIEGAGARAVPIWIDQPESYYREIMGKLNGILLPGGATWFNQTNGYSEAGRYMYDIAMEMNDRGDFFPIWGTCLGFELLTYLSAKNVEHRADCKSMNQPLPLEFKPNFRSSRMFKNASNSLIKILKHEDVTANFHQYCVTETNLTDYNLDREWRVMSVNKDWDGMEFISSIEHKRYPFYGIQFHPEKNLYEWARNKNISHTAHAIFASQYFADFFVNEARKSKHSFQDATDEDNYVIYNFPASFTGLKGSAFEQCYMFDAEEKYNHQTASEVGASDTDEKEF